MIIFTIIRHQGVGYQCHNVGVVCLREMFLDVIQAGLGASVVLGAMIPYVGMSTVMFILFGITSAFAVPVIAALPAEVLRPENRAPGLGIYFVWYFVGSALIPVLGGWAKDLTGTAVSSLLMGTAMYAACIVLLGLLRLEQRRLPILVSDD